MNAYLTFPEKKSEYDLFQKYKAVSSGSRTHDGELFSCVLPTFLPIQSLMKAIF